MKCICLKSDYPGGWYSIERAEHDGREWTERVGPMSFSFRRSARLGTAEIEGPASHMLGLAQAIESGTSASFRRCEAIHTPEGYLLRSPRNEEGATLISHEEALDLARSIRDVVEPTV